MHPCRTTALCAHCAKRSHAGQKGWIDSHELRGGDPLWPELQKAIEEAEAFAVVISPVSFESEWINDELTHVIEVQKQRGRENFPILSFLRRRAVRCLQPIFRDKPSSSRSAAARAVSRPRLIRSSSPWVSETPADVTPVPQPKAEPLEELVLELSDLKFCQQDGVRRASRLSGNRSRRVIRAGRTKSAFRPGPKH